MTTSYPVSVITPHYDADFPLMFGGQGAWQFYAHEEVQKILFDYQHFSNSYMPAAQGDLMLGSNINQVDPPFHGILRNLINGPFSKPAIESQEPWLEDTCHRLLPLKKGAIELVHDFAFPFTTAAICLFLGVPQQHSERIDGWAKAIVTAGYVPGGMETAAIAQTEMAGFFFSLLEARKKEPTGDLLSTLANATVDGAALAIPVQVGTCMTLLLAGFETTANLIAGSVHTLIELPELQQTLRAEPSLIPAALQEILRLKPSLVSMYRKARKDIELNGHKIHSGEMVNAWVSAANRDPGVFSDPHTFDLNRNNFNKVLSFGYGIHHCVGAGLARTMARIALEVILSRMKDIRLVAGTVLKPIESRISSGLQALPITFNT